MNGSHWSDTSNDEFLTGRQSIKEEVDNNYDRDSFFRNLYHSICAQTRLQSFSLFFSYIWKSVTFNDLLSINCLLERD